MSQSTDGYASNLTPAAVASEIGRLQMLIRSHLAGVRVAMPVQVVAVSNSGGVSPVGTVDLQPLVQAVDGTGQVWPHGVIHGCPYMRIQGGANAIILDPQVGDIGIASVCDRDISGVKSAGAQAAPASLRRNDLSDMVYLMTILGAAPSQYIQFTASGINIVSSGAVNITSASLHHNNVNVGATHVHPDAQGGLTGVPQ